MINFSKIGLFVKKLRAFKAWPQLQLAEISGVSERTIQRLEKGEACSFETLGSIASAFGIDVQMLVTLGQDSYSDRLSCFSSSDSSNLIPSILAPIKSGNELANLINGSDSLLSQCDPLKNVEECEVVKEFIQYVHDWGNVQSWIEPRDQVEAIYNSGLQIQILKNLGFLLFGTKTTFAIKGVNGI